MVKKPIKNKVLTILLSISLCALLLTGAESLIGIFNMKDTSLNHINRLAETAAANSAASLRSQVKQEMISLAQSKAMLANEKMVRIQNHTIMVADTASYIYSHKTEFANNDIDYLHPEDAGGYAVHIHTAPGVTKESIQEELNYASSIQYILRQITVADLGINGSYIGTESGLFITADVDAQNPYRTDYDVTNRSWYKGAKEKDGIFWTELFADSSGRGASISCAMPFYEYTPDGRRILRGVAGNGAVLNSINEIIDTTKIGESGYSFLLNERGHVVITPKTDQIHADESGRVIGEDYLGGDDPALRELAAKMTAKESGIMELTLDGKQVYIAYHPLEVLDWSIGVVLEIDEVIAPVNTLRDQILTLERSTISELNENIVITMWVFIAVVVVTVVFVVFLSFRFAGRITRPIQTLAQSVHKISTGDLDVKIDIQTDDEVQQLGDAVTQMSVELKDYIGNLAKTTAEKERLSTELDVAKQIQNSVLPRIFPPFPNHPEFDLYATMDTAKEVGGDFYDFFFIDDQKLCIVIADVSGKGVPAALFMMVARTLIKNTVLTGLPPNEVLAVVNNLLCENNDACMFVTAFMGVVDLETGAIVFSNAGHNLPLLIRRGGSASWLECKSGFALGGMKNMKYNSESLRLGHGDSLFLYTDGVTEAFDDKDNMFTNERLLELLSNPQPGVKDIKALLLHVKSKVDAFANGAEQADDITMLGFHWI